MSFPSNWGLSRPSVKLMVEVAGQVLLAAAATAGVLAIAGCTTVSEASADKTFDKQPIVSASPHKPAAMRSPMASPAESTLVETPAGGNDSDFVNPTPPLRRSSNTPPAVTAAERQRARQLEADRLINEATVPQPTPSFKVSSALRGAEKAIAPLADTLAAIDTAQSAVVDNLRNLENPGFKATRTACGDGRAVTNQVDTTQGELQATRRALDIAIQGEGMLLVRVYPIEHPTGVVGYTRNGRLYVAKDGNLVVGSDDGYRLVPQLQVPVGTTELKIDQDGTLSASQAGSDKSTPQVIGRLVLARFTDSSALQPIGGGVYAESSSSGAAIETPPTERGSGAILQGYLESSNVDLMRERLRLRFLQSWRTSVIAAMEGSPDPRQSDRTDPNQR